MLTTYIKNPRTIILSIIPATIDVESDMGLGLIKKHDNEFRRTIGVLTKVDLLKDGNIEKYLEGTQISKNLQLGYGYYGVRNRSTEESKTMTVKEGRKMEKDFFDRKYGNSLFRKRMGAENLGTDLSEILIDHLRAHLPNVLNELKTVDRNVEERLNEIGRDFPVDETGKRSLLNLSLIHI